MFTTSLSVIYLANPDNMEAQWNFHCPRLGTKEFSSEKGASERWESQATL
jgi:hypothetical protein